MSRQVKPTPSDTDITDQVTKKLQTDFKSIKDAFKKAELPNLKAGLRIVKIIKEKYTEDNLKKILTISRVLEFINAFFS